MYNSNLKNYQTNFMRKKKWTADET